MGDGRFSATEICNHIGNREEYKDTLNRIRNTDVLIVDEVSMLSKKMFEQLEEICCLKNRSKIFGGIQVILCGDFFQLPPVKNTLYEDDGSFCFNSAVFKTAFPHRISLTQIKRQSECKLIEIINELSGKGKELSENTIYQLKQLSRQTEDTGETTTLFSTNLLVDSYNRDAILNEKGDLIEYVSDDYGENKYTSRITAPRKLWLKKDCPVILLRKISDQLVNGSLGRIISCESECVTVFFSKPAITARLAKVSFSGKK